MTTTPKKAPISVVANTPEQRARFVRAAEESERSLSKFMIFAAEQHITRRAERKPMKKIPEEQKVADVPIIMVRPPAEQRERFHAAAAAEGLSLNQFLLYAAEQYIARQN